MRSGINTDAIQRGEDKGLQESNAGRGSSRPAPTYLVDRLLTLLVLLGLLLHLLPLLDVVDEREEVAQVDDERLRLDEDAEEGESGSGRSHRGRASLSPSPGVTPTDCAVLMATNL